MLAMPQMIQEWKEASNLQIGFLDRLLTKTIERTWTWVEEVAKIDGYFLLMRSSLKHRGVYNIRSIAYGKELRITLWCRCTSCFIECTKMSSSPTMSRSSALILRVLVSSLCHILEGNYLLDTHIWQPMADLSPYDSTSRLPKRVLLAKMLTIAQVACPSGCYLLRYSRMHFQMDSLRGILHMLRFE